MTQRQKVTRKQTTKRMAAKANSSLDGKIVLVLKALKASGGATLGELMEVTNWQAHSVRGFLSARIRKKLGLEISRMTREDGRRAYHVAPDAPQRSRAPRGEK